MRIRTWLTLARAARLNNSHRTRTSKKTVVLLTTAHTHTALFRIAFLRYG